MRYRTALFSLLILIGSAQAEPRLHVFAAASLSTPLESITDTFSQSTGIKVSVTYAASSTLARQINQGAPASIFITANPDWLDYLAQNNLVEMGTRQTILSNRLVIATHEELEISPFTFPAEVSTVQSLFTEVQRVATGNPQHVPLGIYAKEALQTANLWEIWRPFLAPSNSARTALALTERQESLIGIHYASDVIQSKHLRQLSLIPEKYHSPIKYELSLIPGKDLDLASRYYDYLLSEEAGHVFSNYGFTRLDQQQ